MPTSESNSPFESAQNLERTGDTESILKAAQEALLDDPGNTAAVELAMDCYHKLGQFGPAADLAAELASKPGFNSENRLVLAFDWHLRAGDYERAEKDLLNGLAVAPNSIKLNRLIAQLLNSQGRRAEASVYVRNLIRLEQIRPEELLSLIDLRGPFHLVEYGDLIDVRNVSLFQLGRARQLYSSVRGSADETISILNPLTEKYPESSAVAAFYGRVLAENGPTGSYEKWLYSELPNGITRQPEYWSSLGTWLSQQNRLKESVRACAEAIRLDPSDRESLRTMITALEELNETEKATQLRQRLSDLDQIFRIAKSADHEQSLWISQTLQEHARPWESIGWLIQSKGLQGTLREHAVEITQRFQATWAWEKSTSRDRIELAKQRQLLGFSASKWPLPDLNRAYHASRLDFSHPSEQVVYRLIDVAATLGLVTKYDSGFPFDKIDDAKLGGTPMYVYQINGGGIAAVDYELDGSVDLYISQAGGTPGEPGGSQPNQMFRLLDFQFSETTRSSGADDRGFSQGVCAGDINQDGFPDLLVSNIGENNVYFNQGDGTFRPAPDLISEKTKVWSSCLAVADLTGDHLPEIVEVNYIDDASSHESKCDPSCASPQKFAKATDDFYTCQPDGTFLRWDTLEAPARLGLGVVITNFDNRNGNDCFIANDGDFNHFWSSRKARTTAGGSKFELVESANIRGCNIGRGGNSQACMGVASGDFNGDGTLDLHVTNFFEEPANLFLQTKNGFFSDEERKYGLHDASFNVLGFGTQAADIDHDGWLDLCVLNGHVNDERKSGVPFQMKSQVFRGGERGFKLHLPKDSGNYWDQPNLGRTLVLLDWNRDGRMDFAGSYLDRQISLLENRTEPLGDWIQLELVGSTSERDAIGTTVSARVGKRTFKAWNTAGDGYMCSNEPLVHLGLGKTSQIDELVIAWPSGLTQTFRNVATNRRYLLVESQAIFARTEPKHDTPQPPNPAVDRL
ncbi:FG-GAP-like repeat-containing protein [Neorhodopirellula pilleata]|uniref:FG-GAP-like repeat-containing protein n=1 Tax=Neorhodopirellula pilleata TaxID=2714738 RepID=UPI0018CEA7E5|nr:FG-GAP-like repeat-containing protein [Neorhodopirellula pilleata]